jgi:hypothetical protein
MHLALFLTAEDIHHGGSIAATVRRPSRGTEPLTLLGDGALFDCRVSYTKYEMGNQGKKGAS